MTLTTLHLGQVPGRVRRAVACTVRHQAHTTASWRSARVAAPAFGGLRATRVVSAGEYTGDIDGGTGAVCNDTTTNPMTKRPTRHLGTRTT